jgi:hypothetical protein
VQAGKSENAALLVSRGAPDDSTDIDRFIGPAGAPTAGLLSISSPSTPTCATG